MFMKIHGDDPKESNGLYKSGSIAMPVALECDEWIECLQFIGNLAESWRQYIVDDSPEVAAENSPHCLLKVIEMERE